MLNSCIDQSDMGHCEWCTSLLVCIHVHVSIGDTFRVHLYPLSLDPTLWSHAQNFLFQDKLRKKEEDIQNQMKQMLEEYKCFYSDY